MVILRKRLKKNLFQIIFLEIYDFYRIVKVSKDVARYKRNDIHLDKKSRKKLRSPLLIGEKVLVLDETLKKKMHQVLYIKVRLKIFHFSTEMLFSQLEKFFQ